MRDEKNSIDNASTVNSSNDQEKRNTNRSNANYNPFKDKSMFITSHLLYILLDDEPILIDLLYIGKPNGNYVLEMPDKPDYTDNNGYEHPPMSFRTAVRINLEEKKP